MTEPNPLYNPYFNPDWKPRPQTASGQLTSITPSSQIDIPEMNAPQNNEGFDAPTAIQGAIGAIDLGIDAGTMASEAKSIQTQAPSAEYDAFGRPVYNVGQFASQTSRIKPRGASAGEVASGIGKGAMAGAQIGSIIPGVGTAIGAVGGAIAGGVAKAFGGRRRKKKMAERKRKAQRSITNRQNNYNTEVEGYNSNRAAMQTYYDQMNNTNRMYNLYQG